MSMTHTFINHARKGRGRHKRNDLNETNNNKHTNTSISKIVDLNDEDVFYRINELYYESISDIEDSFTSDLAKIGTEELLKKVQDFKCIIVEEEVVL